MPARKNQHVSFDGTQTAQNLIGPRANLIRRFAAGTTIAEQLPVRTLRMDLHRSEAFVFAVVPFDQFTIGFCNLTEASQLAGACGALQRTCEDLRENEAGKPLTKPAGVLFTPLGQWQIGKPRMLARKTPHSLAVPCQINLW